jgi:poly-gamma-glutamate synthesis protein (capsule biosynthesis protein)
LEKVKKIIADLNGRTDLIIVNIHWGVEYEHVFNKTQQDLARDLIDSGADIIIGHHPHVVQGLEIYKNKPIFYSLGNFIFDQDFSRDTQEELAVEINFNPDGQAKARLYPLLSRQSQPSLMAGKEKENYLKKIAGWSKGDSELFEQIKKGEMKINF